MNSTAGHCRPICGILNHSILVSSSSYHYIFDHLLHQVRFRFKLTVIITVLLYLFPHKMSSNPNSNTSSRMRFAIQRFGQMLAAGPQLFRESVIL